MKKNPASEKRKFIRLDLRSEINFDVIETSDEKITTKRFRAIGKNIGAEGILLTAEQELPRRTVLDLEVFFPDRPDPIHIRGEVRWCLPIKEDPGKFDIGVRFLNVNKDNVFLLVQYVCGHLGEEIIKRLSVN